MSNESIIWVWNYGSSWYDCKPNYESLMHFKCSCYQGQQCLNVMVGRLKFFSMAVIFGLACCLKFMSRIMKGQVSTTSLGCLWWSLEHAAKLCSPVNIGCRWCFFACKFKDEVASYLLHLVFIGLRPRVRLYRTWCLKILPMEVLNVLVLLSPSSPPPPKKKPDDVLPQNLWWRWAQTIREIEKLKKKSHTALF